MEYDNGEIETVGVAQVEPEEDYSPISGSTRGGKYAAVVREIIQEVWCS